MFVAVGNILNDSSKRKWEETIAKKLQGLQKNLKDKYDEINNAAQKHHQNKDELIKTVSAERTNENSCSATNNCYSSDVLSVKDVTEIACVLASTVRKVLKRHAAAKSSEAASRYMGAATATAGTAVSRNLGAATGAAGKVASRKLSVVYHPVSFQVIKYTDVTGQILRKKVVATSFAGSDVIFDEVIATSSTRGTFLGRYLVEETGRGSNAVASNVGGKVAEKTACNAANSTAKTLGKVIKVAGTTVAVCCLAKDIYDLGSNLKNFNDPHELLNEVYKVKVDVENLKKEATAMLTQFSSMEAQ